MTARVAAATAIASSFIVIGCASPVVTYSGVRLPDSEVSILRIDGRGRILGIDDRSFNGRVFELMPGDHSVHFKLTLRGDEVPPEAHTRPAIMFCDAVFRADPGHFYEIVRIDPEPVSSSGTPSEVKRSNEFRVHLRDLGNGRDVERFAIFCEWS